MEIDKIVQRAKALLLTPRTEWPVIAAEPASVADLYKNYLAIVAAIPAVFGFIKGSLIGYSALGVTMKVPVMAGISSMILSYALSLAMVYVLALVVDALAPNFAGEKNFTQALKAVGYSFTASWVAGAAVILPFLGSLVVLAGGIYSIYLLYLALPQTMKAPAERSLGYTAITVVIGIVLSLVIGSIVAGVAGTSAMVGAAAQRLGADDPGISIDRDSALGRMAEYGKKMEAASQRVEEAKAKGDDKAAAEATAALLGAALGGGDQVQALAPATLKNFVPESLGGMRRTEYSAEQNGAMGMQMSVAHAAYGNDEGGSLRLSITDVGSAKGLLGLANAANLQTERETERGYEKTYKQGDRLVHERWDNERGRGEYNVVLANRFTIALEGSADSMDVLKEAVRSLDLDGLEALRNEGVKR